MEMETMMENFAKQKTAANQVLLKFNNLLEQAFMTPRKIFNETMEELKRYQNEYSAKADESTDSGSLDRSFNERRNYLNVQVTKIWSDAFLAASLYQIDIATCYNIACFGVLDMISKLNEKFKAVEASFENLKKTVKNR